jgi:hypothetical protein
VRTRAQCHRYWFNSAYVPSQDRPALNKFEFRSADKDGLKVIVASVATFERHVTLVEYYTGTR